MIFNILYYYYIMFFTKRQFLTLSFYLTLILSIYYNNPTNDLVKEYTNINIFIAFIMNLFLIIRII